MDKNIKKFPTHKVEYGQVNEPDTLAMTYENQTRALEIRAKEIEFEKQEEEHGFEFSKYTLETQFLNQKTQLSHAATAQRNAYLFMTVIFSGIISLIGTALILNKDSIVIEMFKIVAYIFAGGIGGYGLKTVNKKDHRIKEDEDNI